MLGEGTMIQTAITAAPPKKSTYTVEGVDLTLKQAIRWLRAERRRNGMAE